ncbi:MAG: type I-C CRISPR-associated protein Cas8c/Csd1 [Deltaproteobacteria bacterium]|nr:type I-C CRISPR-associated protein Cas8c/Csd1 [Deltaproteobacteria bacterium]
MIMQSLVSYYRRLRDDPEGDIPMLGFSRQKIHFALVINRDGELIQVRDLRQKEAKKLLPKQLVVSEPVKKTMNVAPNFMWENTGYVLGSDDKGDMERAHQKFAAFKEHHHNIGDGLEDDGMKAVLRFLESWNAWAWELKYGPLFPAWEELAKSNVVFQLDGELQFVHDRPQVQDAWLSYYQGSASEVMATCLVKGQPAPIARLHPDIKGVWGAQPKGASLVSFNLDAFKSYGKDQSYNAPVSEEAAFAYATALNHLLRDGSWQRIQIGDASTVFWTERASPVEMFMGIIFDPKDDTSDLEDIRLFLEAVRDGKQPHGIDDSSLMFYILGLSPNVSRLAVRFWHASTVADICSKIGQHFKDLSIVKSFEKDREFPGMWQLLRETAVLGKTENISPILAGTVMRSILTGATYPRTLLTAIITRIRADQTVNYLRAAMIKAYLVRKYRVTNTPLEVTMSLDHESTQIGYRLGRLFAALEKAQKDALGNNINATIRDRYYSSASATPRAVFPQLVRLAQHHISKSEYKGVDKQIETIVSGIQEFPAHLNLEDQGMFAIGYYHQRQAFYTKSEDKKENPDD